MVQVLECAEQRAVYGGHVTGDPTRGTFRAHVREQVLATAHALTIERGWDRVRVAEIASLVGVSRPTIYKEFGDKQGLGDALVVREAERFLAGIRSVLSDRGGDPATAIASSVRFTLDEAAASPLLRAVLTSNRPAESLVDSVDGTGVLPLLRTSASLLQVASESLVGWISEQFPDLEGAEINDSVDALVRLTVSHLVLPSGDSTETNIMICVNITSCIYSVDHQATRRPPTGGAPSGRIR